MESVNPQQPLVGLTGGSGPAQPLADVRQTAAPAGARTPDTSVACAAPRAARLSRTDPPAHPCPGRRSGRTPDRRWSGRSCGSQPGCGGRGQSWSRSVSLLARLCLQVPQQPVECGLVFGSADRGNIPRSEESSLGIWASIRTVSLSPAPGESPAHHDAGALATWLVGLAAKANDWTRHFQANTESRKPVLSLFFLGRRVLRSLRFVPSKQDLADAMAALPIIVDRSAQHA